MAETMDFLNSQLFTKSLSAFFVMALADTCLGTFRTLILSKFVSKPVEETLGVLTAVGSVLGISYTLIDWIGPTSRSDLAKIGVLWYGSMVGFDAALGKLRGLSNEAIIRAFNPVEGGYLGLYMSVLFLAPFMAYDIKFGGRQA